MKKLLCVLLLMVITAQLCACVSRVSAMGGENLMQDITAQVVEGRESDAAFSDAMASFAVKLLNNTHVDGENTMLSPYSALLALAMTANGADGETLKQMELVFGLPMEELNAYLYTGSQNEGKELTAANSIWMRDAEDFSVYETFLQTNADYYGADVYTAPFDDRTVTEINTWVAEHTRDRIKSILQTIPEDASMYLINALTFLADWEEPYTDDQLREGEFHGANGTVTAELLHSSEHYYLEDARAIGFRKNYDGGRYSFIALLPNEDISVEEYLASLDGKALLRYIENEQYCAVTATMPKFTLNYRADLTDALQTMGMELAFTNDADFSRMSETPMHISCVAQKTWICVDEKGTEAAAATVVEAVPTSAEKPEPPKVVCIDRPFVCGIYDNEERTFLFLGIVNEAEQAEP